MLEIEEIKTNEFLATEGGDIKLFCLKQRFRSLPKAELIETSKNDFYNVSKGLSDTSLQLFKEIKRKAKLQTSKFKEQVDR